MADTKQADTTNTNNVNNDEADQVKGMRYFRCTYNGVAFGRYSGKKPKQAASKAFTAMVKKNGGNDKCVGKQFVFEMTECTRGCSKKITKYEGARLKLTTPVVVNIKRADGNRAITYNFNNVVKKFREEEEKKPKKAKDAKKDV